MTDDEKTARKLWGNWTPPCVDCGKDPYCSSCEFGISKITSALDEARADERRRVGEELLAFVTQTVWNVDDTESEIRRICGLEDSDD